MLSCVCRDDNEIVSQVLNAACVCRDDNEIVSQVLNAVVCL